MTTNIYNKVTSIVLEDLATVVCVHDNKTGHAVDPQEFLEPAPAIDRVGEIACHVQDNGHHACTCTF